MAEISKLRGTFYPTYLPRRARRSHNNISATSCACRKEIKDIMRAFRKMPGFSELGMEPEKSTSQNIKDLSQRLRVPSTLLSLIGAGIDRVQNNVQPTNELEKSLFEMIQNLPEGPKASLKNFVAKLREVPSEWRDRIIKPIDGEITVKMLAPRIIEETINLLPEVLPDWFDPDMFGTAGRVRPCPLNLGEFGGRLEVVDPTICTIMGLRRATHIPEPVPWADPELERECEVSENSRGEPVVECGRPQLGTREDPCQAGATSSSVCLRVPEVPHGTTVRITGFNFVSSDARVRLRDPVDPTIEHVLPARVAGDRTVPVEEVSPDGELSVICDCRVQDSLYFDLPTHWDPAGAEEVMAGDYTIRVEFKNPGDYLDTESVFSSRRETERLVSKWDKIRVLPPEDLRGRISLDEIWCDEETDGLGSDDLLLRVSGFTINDGGVSRISPTPPRFRHDDFDSREAFADSPPSGYRRVGSSLNQVLFEGTVPDFIVLNVIGFEVEDLALAEEKIMEFDEAFGYAIEWLWDNVISVIPAETWTEIGGAIDAGGFWGYIIAGVAVVFTLGAILIWSAISVPDVILLEFIAIPKTHFYFLTHPRNPLPPPTAEVRFGESPNQVRVTAAPVSKLANDYIEARRHRNEDEDSTYRLIMRYSRI